MVPYTAYVRIHEIIQHYEVVYPKMLDGVRATHSNHGTAAGTTMHCLGYRA